MEHIADTLPDPRHQTVNRKAQPARPAPAQRIQAVAVMEAPAKAAEAKPKAKDKSKEKPGAHIAAWWPVAVGVLLSGFAAQWYSDSTQISVWAVRLFFPFTQLVQHGEIGISAHMVEVLPRYALYLQFPLEGLLTKLTLDRGKGLQSAIVQLILIHGLCALVLWMLPFLQH